MVDANSRSTLKTIDRNEVGWRYC